MATPNSVTGAASTARQPTHVSAIACLLEALMASQSLAKPRKAGDESRLPVTMARSPNVRKA